MGNGAGKNNRAKGNPPIAKAVVADGTLANADLPVAEPATKQPSTRLALHPNLHSLLTVEQELGDNLLHPSCTWFGIGWNNYIIVSKIQIIPDRRINMMIMELSSFNGRGSAIHKITLISLSREAE